MGQATAESGQGFVAFFQQIEDLKKELQKFVTLQVCYSNKLQWVTKMEMHSLEGCRHCWMRRRRILRRRQKNNWRLRQNLSAVLHLYLVTNALSMQVDTLQTELRKLKSRGVDVGPTCLDVCWVDGAVARASAEDLRAAQR
eukprot:766605-Hanusia_phi.AAC.18